MHRKNIFQSLSLLEVKYFGWYRSGGDDGLISNPEVEVLLDIKREGFFCVVYTASKSKSVVEDVNSISRDDLSRAQESQSRKRACVTAR